MANNKKSGRAKGILISLLVTFVFGFVYFYVTLPALHPQAQEFWAFLILLILVFTVCSLLTSGSQIEDVKDIGRVLKAKCKIPVILLIIIVVVTIAGAVFSMPVFHSKAYYELLDVQTGDFGEDVAEISYNKIPMLDKDSSVQLGRRALGSISENSNLVSQFEVADHQYSQINVQNEPVRVAPLMYGNLIKWLNNRGEGLPGYIQVNMVTQEADLIRLDEGMKYSTDEHFSRNVYRHLRFQYPTMMFGDVNFEIDEEGTPWWVCSRVVKRIGLFGGTDIKGAVLMNAITGECTYHEEVPSWVDRVYDADTLVQQYNYHGTLVNGWVNSWLGQKGITTTTEGYNYIAMNDDVYLYTGVTSAGSDDSNVGFILVNQRTKDARFYKISGATERSAMSSAQGAVQHLNYSSTFPILLNISDQPTYFMALKDSAQLVKMYAMVNVADYQITATGNSVAQCQANYEALLQDNGYEVTEPVEEPSEGNEIAEGTIAEIRSAVINGNTVFYFNLGDDKFYAISASECPEAVIFNVGDSVKITYHTGEGQILNGTKVE